ncbi:CcoQ/FixQ family Cbb3-type cytochrome c oxidase assembly chaperone [Galbibacter mesophilus]|uniref:CcoQ/FixQ family Cbb3-type cytochrome c oxidase assembly chaperone n=1 Tax=Galbibacter mesophilus TaxID=379069 RepID=UPI001F5D5C2C|nr:CcoQ/FixQ family Cbb3-type cytochrome c oxidase assembly chaperone [Galbibacter mesophilus]MCM5664214.1 CcoQ/FixQ family Cbb3-type cytochrome c oxidase assembly chaperone [Galbibacter mesophilus]
MMKFAKNYMDSIDGVAIYPIFSLLIFFVFFVILFWWVFTANKDYIQRVSNFPLEENDQQNKTS